MRTAHFCGSRGQVYPTTLDTLSPDTLPPGYPTPQIPYPLIPYPPGYPAPPPPEGTRDQTYPTPGRNMALEKPYQPCGHTDTYENIAFPQLRWHAVMNVIMNCMESFDLSLPVNSS